MNQTLAALRRNRPSTRLYSIRWPQPAPLAGHSLQVTIARGRNTLSRACSPDELTCGLTKCLGNRIATMFSNTAEQCGSQDATNSTNNRIVKEHARLAPKNGPRLYCRNRQGSNSLLRNNLERTASASIAINLSLPSLGETQFYQIAGSCQRGIIACRGDFSEILSPESRPPFNTNLTPKRNYIGVLSPDKRPPIHFFWISARWA